MKNRKYVIISLAIIAMIIVCTWLALYGLFSADPPIKDELLITETKSYMEVGRYMKKLLKDNYPNVFPQKIPKDCLPEYLYKYSCDFDGRLYFSLYLNTEYDSFDDFILQKELVHERALDADIKTSGEKQYIIHKVWGLENYYLETERIYTGYSLALIEINDAERTIKYLVTEQYSNMKEQPDVVKNLLANFGQDILGYEKHRVEITDIYGEKIWWHSSRREHLDYILEKRPELKNVVVTRKGA